MTRTILSSLAVVAMLATSATPAVSQAKLSGQQPTHAPFFNALTTNENINENIDAAPLDCSIESHPDCQSTLIIPKSDEQTYAPYQDDDIP